MPAGSRARRVTPGARDAGRGTLAAARRWPPLAAGCPTRPRAPIALFRAPCFPLPRLMWVLEYPRNHKSKYLVLPRLHQY